jgi:hypothetical protein
MFEGVIALGTVEHHPFGPGLSDDFQVVGSQFLEQLHLTIPQHIVTAAMLVVTHHWFDAGTVKDLDNVLAHREAIHPNVPKDHLKIGHAAHEEEGVALLGHFSRFLGPLGFFLVYALGLHFHDCLQHAMMGINGLGSEFGGFFSEEAHELREVDAGWAALRTATAGQT